MRQHFADNRTDASRGTARALNLPRTTDRMAIKEDIMRQPIDQVTAQRAKPVNMTKRLEACLK